MSFCSVLCYLCILSTAVNSVQFRGSCPIPPPSTGKIPQIFPESLADLVPLSDISTLDAPFFSTRILGIGAECDVQLRQLPSEPMSFTLSQPHNDCPSLQGIITPKSETADYKIKYEYNFKDGKHLQCLHNWTFENPLSIFADDGILLFWICINNRPNLGSYDEGLAAFVGADAKRRDYQDRLRNMFSFTNLPSYHIIKKTSQSCPPQDRMECPAINCPTVRESWRNSLGLIIWFLLFVVVSLVSSSFCGLIPGRRRTRVQRILVETIGPHLAWVN